MTKTIHVRLMILLFLGIVASTAYGEPQISTERQYKIKAGVGLEECPIELCDETRFNQQFQSTKTGAYLLAPQQGVDALLRRGKVRTFFFYFNSERKGSFNGKTEAGIEKSSTRDDVIRQYGKTNDILIGPVSLDSGGWGEVETLRYEQKGISFTFINKKLADIRVYSPPLSRPDISIQEKRSKLLGEWVANWAYSQNVPYKEALLTGRVSAALRLEAGGTAMMYIPCDINEKFTKDMKITGTWNLNDRGEFEAQFKQKSVGIKGMLMIDEESEDIDQLIITQTNNMTKKFGRFDRSQLNCN
ncbi:MAG: hypothetical protein Q8L69_10050 [Gallionellaceae bacterium]|nr:hypothetical protein [Gallionellaceae bacterium]